MLSAAEYREEASRYVLQAEGATDARRLRLLEMAQSCLRLADQADLLDSEAKPNGQHGPVKIAAYEDTAS